MRSMVEREAQGWATGAKSFLCGASLSTALRAVPLPQMGEERSRYGVDLTVKTSRRGLPRGAETQPPHPGEIIFSGRTASSNSASVRYPPPTASSRNVVPFLWAVLAILAQAS